MHSSVPFLLGDRFSFCLRSVCCTSGWASPVFCARPEPGVTSGRHEAVALGGWEPAEEESRAPPLPSSPRRKFCGSLLGCHPRRDTVSRTNRGGMTSLSSAPSQQNAINKGRPHVMVLVNLNTVNTKDVPKPCGKTSEPRASLAST